MRKDLVVRDTTNKVHIYKAAVKENETKNNLMEDFINVSISGFCHESGDAGTGQFQIISRRVERTEISY
jgi:hypothetical protein